MDKLEALRAWQDQKTQKRPMKDWLTLIRKSDVSLMSRTLEDIIDALDEDTRGRIDPRTLDKYNQKKDLRLQKPQD